MSDAQLILYDDALARSWFPFSTTRPAGELRFGALTLRERAELVAGAPCLGHVTASALAGFDEPGAAPAIDLARTDNTRTRIFLSSRAVPHWELALPDTPETLCIDHAVVGFVCPPGTPAPTQSQLLHTQPGVEGRNIGGTVVGQVWELISHNTHRLRADLEHLYPSPGSTIPEGVRTLGPPQLSIGQNVQIEPCVVLDFRAGPIRLDDGVEVRAFTRLAGPAHIARHTVLLGGSFASVSIGPHCKVHGEMEECVVLGYSNKAHDGFLGHAYLGSWVNLGALTTNSDLKNNYGPVRLWTPNGEVATPELKLGCFLGDHVKTAIGTMINTGTVIGAGSNLFGGVPPRYVPPFCWGASLGEYEFDKFIATAERVMARRQVPLTPAQRQVLRRAYEQARVSAAVEP